MTLKGKYQKSDQRGPVVIVLGFCRPGLTLAALAYLMLLCSILLELMWPDAYIKEWLTVPAYLILLFILLTKLYKTWKVNRRLRNGKSA